MFKSVDQAIHSAMSEIMGKLAKRLGWGFHANYNDRSAVKGFSYEANHPEGVQLGTIWFKIVSHAKGNLQFQYTAHYKGKELSGGTSTGAENMDMIMANLFVGLKEKVDNGKMASGDLRSQLVRLAYEQPQLRDDLLPLLSEDSKSASINDRTIIWEYFGTDYDNEIAYRDDLMMSSFKSFTGAVHALVALKNEAKKKGFIGRGIRFKRKGQNNMQALVQGSSDQGMGDELFYHHQIKFVGFEGEEMKNMIDIVSKW